MTPERWERVKQLFEQVSELPQAQRRDGLAREAGDDPELVAEVQSLLEWHERAGPFAEAVPEALCADVFAPQRGARRSGERIGAYRIEELIGTGGMGDVYRAVRDDAEYHAEVAIKIMRGMSATRSLSNASGRNGRSSPRSTTRTSRVFSTAVPRQLACPTS